MAMIRQANARSMARDAVVLDLGDLLRQGAQLQARARAEAELILAEARAERERIIAGAAAQGLEEGRAQGLQEGRAQGLAEGREEALAAHKDQLDRLGAAWTNALDEFVSEREGMLADMRHEVLRLGIRIGELVTKRMVAVHPEVVVEQLAAVLEMLVNPTRLVVRAHPDDLPLLREALPTLAERFSAGVHVELASDPAVERGSCIVCTGTAAGGGGEIDASIGTQLERIVAALIPQSGEEVSGQERSDGL